MTVDSPNVSGTRHCVPCAVTPVDADTQGLLGTSLTLR